MHVGPALHEDKTLCVAHQILAIASSNTDTTKDQLAGVTASTS